MSRHQNWSFWRQNRNKSIWQVSNTCLKLIPSFVLDIGIMGLNMNVWTCWRSKMFETRQMGKVVQNCENIQTSRQTDLEVLQVIKYKLQHLYKINCSDNSSVLALKNHLPFHKKIYMWVFNEKIYIYFFFQLLYFFVTHGDMPAIINCLDLLLSELSHNKIPQHSKPYLQSLETKLKTYLIFWQS